MTTAGTSSGLPTPEMVSRQVGCFHLERDYDKRWTIDG
jgi:hypothetical protein